MIETFTVEGTVKTASINNDGNIVIEVDTGPMYPVTIELNEQQTLDLIEILHGTLALAKTGKKEPSND